MTRYERLPVKRLASLCLGKMLQPDPRTEDDVAAPYLRAANVQPDGVLRVEDPFGAPADPRGAVPAWSYGGPHPVEHPSSTKGRT